MATLLESEANIIAAVCYKLSVDSDSQMSRNKSVAAPGWWNLQAQLEERSTTIEYICGFLQEQF